MSRKRSRKHKPKTVEAVPEEVLAEGSGAVSDAAAEMTGVAGSADAGADIEAGEAVAADAGEDIEASEAVAVDAGEDIEAGEAVAVDAASDVSSETEGVEAASGDVAGDGEDAQIDGAGDGEIASGDETYELPTSAASMEPDQLKRLVEALVFASDKPITVLRLRQLTRISDVKRLEQALADLAEDYTDRGLVLQQVSGGYQFRTRSQYSLWVQQLIAGRPVRLSRAQLETLAIVAYRQPITRPEIDEIRGVDSSGTLRVLSERGLVRTLGKKEEVGRPMLYGTTKEFLDFFSLGDLRELPTLREYSELSEESRQVMTDRLGAVEDDEAAAHSEATASTPEPASPEQPMIADGSDATPTTTSSDGAEGMAFADGSDATPMVADAESTGDMPLVAEPDDPVAESMIAAESLEPEPDDPAEPAHE
ncbi:MAG: SMC-Scp complex subunit ScpB [Kofleriaceae bacterium]